MGLTENHVIAEVTKDYLLGDDAEDSCLYQYLYVGFRRYWVTQNMSYPINPYFNFPALRDLVVLPKTKFKAYDDDDILYYAGWLYSDPDELMVLQYIYQDLRNDSGIAYIKIQDPNTGEWKIEVDG